MKCKNCQNELTSVEIFAHLADHGHEEGLCNNCNRERKEFGGDTIPEGYDKGQKQNKAFRACYVCGKPLTWDKSQRTDSGGSIPLDLTGQPHECPNSSYAKPKLTSHTKVEVKKPEKKPEEVQPVQISESILFDIEKIPKDDPIINEIIDGHNEKQLGIIHYDRLTAPEPSTIPLEKLSDVLENQLLDGLKKYGFSGVLEFQNESIRTILSGKNVIISAPTGSGKTEAFVIPIIQKILKNYSNGVYALLVYPLNALIDDQMSKIKDLIEKCGLQDRISAFSIHGQQSAGYKDMIIEKSKEKCVLLATNFDFINWHLIIQDEKWNQLFKPAKVIVMDEAHSYSSFHGSNVYHVIKRMKKYMRNVQFIGSSATLDNPKAFFSDMFDLPVESVMHIKSLHGKKRDMHRLFIMPRKFGQRSTMEKLGAICFQNKKTQLIFSNTHNDAEFLATNVDDDNKNVKIEVHRGGMNPADRKEHELGMKFGDLDILSCTPTLELGIDIGHVDVAISAFKNEYDSFIQRIGRAGRKGQKSYAICVFDPDDASCHYYSRNIDKYIHQKHDIKINKDNKIISDRHAKAEQIEEKARNTWQKKPFFDFANTMNLRGTSGEVIIYQNNEKLGTRDVPVAYYQLHQKSIYHFNKHVYEVDSIIKTKDGGQALVSPSDEKYKKTQPMVLQKLTSEEEIDKKIILWKTNGQVNDDDIFSLRYGMIEIDRTIIGYYKGDFNKPIETFETFKGEDDPSWKNFNWKSRHMAVGIELPGSFISNQSQHDENNQNKVDPSIHTIIHVLANAAKIITKAESMDIEAYNEGKMIYLYDNTAEGVNGCSKIIYDNFEKVLEICKNLLSDCNCGKPNDADWGGCPKCTYTTGFCETKNKQLSKLAACNFFVISKI